MFGIFALPVMLKLMSRLLTFSPFPSFSCFHVCVVDWDVLTGPITKNAESGAADAGGGTGGASAEGSHPRPLHQRRPRGPPAAAAAAAVWGEGRPEESTGGCGEK